MAAPVLTQWKTLLELLYDPNAPKPPLPQKTLRALARIAAFPEALEDYHPHGRVSCADVLQLCRPVLDQLTPEPEGGWLLWFYGYLSHRLFPDPNRPADTRAQQQAAWFYCAVLDRLLLQAEGLTGDQKTAQLLQLVRQSCAYQEGSGSTAYSALIDGQADSQGMALAFALLCQRGEIPCVVVDGQLGGVSHLWNVVQTADGYRHIDLTQPDLAVYRTDGEMTAAGYTWDGERVPACTAEES